MKGYFGNTAYEFAQSSTVKNMFYLIVLISSLLWYKKKTLPLYNLCILINLAPKYYVYLARSILNIYAHSLCSLQYNQI